MVVWWLCSLDYMQQTGGQAHLFFWMTVEGYRVTAQQQLEVLQSRQKDGKHQTNQTKGLLRAAAFGVYEQYLSEKVGITYFCIDWNLVLYSFCRCFCGSYGYINMKWVWCSTSWHLSYYLCIFSSFMSSSKKMPSFPASPCPSFKKVHTGTGCRMHLMFSLEADFTE